MRTDQQKEQAITCSSTKTRCMHRENSNIKGVRQVEVPVQAAQVLNITGSRLSKHEERGASLAAPSTAHCRTGPPSQGASLI